MTNVSTVSTDGGQLTEVEIRHHERQLIANELVQLAEAERMRGQVDDCIALYGAAGKIARWQVTG